MADTDGEPEVSAEIPKPTEPETPKPSETPAPEGLHDNTKELIAELSGKVDALAATVSDIITHGSDQDDSSPVKPPWTHRKLF